MTCYPDEYPLLCCKIIKFQSRVFRTCRVLKFNVRSAQLKKNSHIYTCIDAVCFNSYAEQVLKTILFVMIDR